MNHQCPLAHTQLTELIVVLALKRVLCADLGKDTGELVRVWQTKNRVDGF
jgi:hypothetical protein